MQVFGCSNYSPLKDLFPRPQNQNLHCKIRFTSLLGVQSAGGEEKPPILHGRDLEKLIKALVEAIQGCGCPRQRGECK